MSFEWILAYQMILSSSLGRAAKPMLSIACLPNRTIQSPTQGNVMRFVSFILTSLLVGALNGCSMIGTREGDGAVYKPACVAPQPDTFVAAAEWHPGEYEPLGMMDRLMSYRKLDGDLVIGKSSVSFVPSSKIEGRNDPGIPVYPFDEIELAYRKDNWVFIRGYPEQEYRQFQGYYIHGKAQAAEAAFAELLKHLQNRTPPLIFPSSTTGKVILVSKGGPEIRVAVVDREGIGKKSGETAVHSVSGALGGPITDPRALILIPVVVPLVFLGGAVVGAAQGEIEAQRNAQVTVMVDPVLVKAAHDMDIPARFVREIEQRMQIERDWNVAVDSSTTSTHGPTYEDDALQGIVGAVELAPLRIELRTNKSDLDKNTEEAEYALSVTQQVWVYSTLSGQAVESIDVIAGSGRHTLSEWREDAGKRFAKAVSDAVKDIPDTIVTNLPNALNKLIRFE
jgi:hypothetical protein